MLWTVKNSSAVALLSRWMFFVALCFWCAQAQAQRLQAGAPEQASVLQDTLLVHYPGMLRLFTDTIWAEKSVHQLTVAWMDTSFQLERKHAEFVTDVLPPKKDNPYYELYREEPWYADGYCTPHANCYSFGLAQAFASEGIDPGPLFNPTTFVPFETLEILLKTAFEKVDSLDGTSLADLKQPIPVGSLLIFRDSTGMLQHAAYQAEEGLLSKNGNFEPRIYSRLEYLKRVYYDITTIELYRMQADKVKAYLDDRPQHALLEE